MITKSSGFSLVELLVVIAIIGILSAAGTLTYTGYVKGAKRNSAENLIQQVSLAQSEEYANTGDYFITGGAMLVMLVKQVLMLFKMDCLMENQL